MIRLPFAATALVIRAHQGHAISIGFGLLLTGVAGIGSIIDERVLGIGAVGLYTQC
jgi:hypothetical protein